MRCTTSPTKCRPAGSPRCGCRTARRGEATRPTATADGTCCPSSGSRHWRRPHLCLGSQRALRTSLESFVPLAGRPRPARWPPWACLPYYVALTTDGSPHAAHRYGAGIYATATGVMVASVSAPGKARTFVGVSAAANDLTFVAAAESYPPSGLPAVTFCLIRFDPASRSAKVSNLPEQRVPAG